MAFIRDGYEIIDILQRIIITYVKFETIKSLARCDINLLLVVVPNYSLALSKIAHDIESPILFIALNWLDRISMVFARAPIFFIVLACPWN